MNHTNTGRVSEKQTCCSKSKELIDAPKVLLATVDAEGNPNSSYAPFVQEGNTFYILVSFMAKHTKNLSEGRKTSVMFIEDESATKQIYARERLTLEAQLHRLKEILKYGILLLLNLKKLTEK
jgi:putative heme iron utilization protein